ncbi:hypothetical protein RJ035_000500 [Blastomyces gilchristii]
MGFHIYYGNWACGPDLELLPLVDIANIACGFHAGDPLITMETVRNLKAHNVKIGAHPGLPDLQGFGRREMKLPPEELTTLTVYQVGALKGFWTEKASPSIAQSRDVGYPQGNTGLWPRRHQKAAKDLGIPFWAELYGDVKYRTDGSSLLIDRKKKPWDLVDVEKHVTQLIRTQSVTAVDGTGVAMPVGNYPVSICCHSDSPGCVEIIGKTREVINLIRMGKRALCECGSQYMDLLPTSLI